MQMPIVVELFRPGANRAVIDWVLTDADPDEWYTSSEIESIVGYKGMSEVISGDDLNLVECGVLDTKHDLADEPPNIPHYGVGDTEVVELLRAWDGYPLTELLDEQSAHKLVSYFLTDADPERAYSGNDLRSDTPLGYRAVTYMDRLVDAGLVEEVEGPRSTRYRLNVESELAVHLSRLNDELIKTFEDRHERRAKPTGSYPYDSV